MCLLLYQRNQLTIDSFCGMTDEFCDKGTKDDPGCQSNCDQPGSGSSGGDVQKKVIGYYEAWAHDRKCQGMVSNA
jgi:chitinase